jgi:7-cyano-7-deazaguanine synthase
MRSLVVCSGGMDSVVLAHVTASEGNLAGLVSFNYGQRHAKELWFAEAAATRYGVPFHLVDLSTLAGHLSRSALTGETPVPDGHYAEDTMKATIVPNRNAIMLAVAFGVAVNNDCDEVATAVHAGDHYIYPDCRPAFTGAFAYMQRMALEGVAEVALHTPFVEWTKAKICTHGSRHHVPFEHTWSCYKGLAQHCGRCGTCVERREAFHLAGVYDPTTYQDEDFWTEAVKTGRET